MAPILIKRLYFFLAIKFFFILLWVVSAALGPLLLGIRIFNPKCGTLKVRRFISKAVKIYLYLLNRTRLHTLSTNLETCKLEKGSIFISNHTSLLDALYYMALFPEICAIIKQNLFYLSPFSLISYSAGYISNSPKENTVNKVISVLEKGENIFIFPEGTRKPINQAMRIKRGACMIAIRSGATMYFGHIKHSEEILSKNTPIFYAPRNSIQANIHFSEIPTELIRVNKEETPWVASRRISKLLETRLNSTLGLKA